MYHELSIKDKITAKAALKILHLNDKEYKIINYKFIEGNRTQYRLVEAYLNMMEAEGHTVLENWEKKNKRRNKKHDL